MKLDCQITESLQRDFSALWKCQQRGDSLEITTPYLLPDSTLLSLFLTQRENRFIVCDGGGVFEVIEDYCPFPRPKAIAELEGYAQKFGLKQGHSEGKPLFFKDCDDVRFISSLAFDVATFATMATSAMVASAEEIETEDRFKVKADAYNALLESQNGVCAICGRGEMRKGRHRLAVDHCHTTGKIRGLLCGACNDILGRSSDNPKRLLDAVRYLKRHS